jgi:hypothetical protein
MKQISILLFFVCSFVAAQAADLKDKIVAQERAELQALKSADYKKFADLIADDAVFVAPQGPATKQEVVQHVADFKLLDFTMDDIRFVQLSPNSGVVAYKLTQKGSAGGHEFTTTVYASATWVRQNGNWVSVFSQETPARKETGSK